MYNGTKKVTNNTIELFSGLSTLEFMGINLTADQIKERFGFETKEREYKIRTDNFNNEVLDCTVYFRDVKTKRMIPMNLTISKSENKTQKGNYQVCTSNGSIVWAGKTDGDSVIIKEEFEAHRPLRMGEDLLITLVQRLVNYDTRLGEGWLEQMAENKQTLECLYNGDTEGFDALYRYCKEEKLVISGIVGIKYNGDKAYMSVVNNPKVIYSGPVSDWTIERCNAERQKQVKAGYELTNLLYSINRQSYDVSDGLENCLSDCFNFIKATPQGSTSQW